MKILVTGSAGFIGYHVTKLLLERGDEVVGFDSLNDYYEVELKYKRLLRLGIEKKTETLKEVTSTIYPLFKFVKGNLTDYSIIEKIFKNENFDYVCHLAAQAGVRYSIENPRAYIESNINGFFNILEACRWFPVKHLVYASSSSVYGLNKKVPFSVHDNVDFPASFYAATKKSNELMAHTYSHLYSIPTTGLRFFTVYGPWGRPDMAPIIFSRAILNKKKIKIFNKGQMERDFTYIDDIVKGILAVIEKPEKYENEKVKNYNLNIINKAPFRILNIGYGKPIKLMDFVKILEIELGQKAICDYVPMQLGDVVRTWADTTDLENLISYKPETPITEGIKKFVSWFLEYEKSK